MHLQMNHAPTSPPPVGVLQPPCPSGHAMEGDNLRLNKRGDRICRTCHRAAQVRWRKAHPEQRRSLKKASEAARRKSGNLRYGYSRICITKTVTRDHVEQMFEAVREHGRVSAIYPVLGKWKARAFLYFNPKIGAALHKARGTVRRAKKAPAISLRNPDRVARLVERIKAAVPIYLQRDMRDDIISEITLAVIEGRIRASALDQHIKKFVNASFRDDHNKYGPLSLDMPAFEDGTTPLVETISQGLWQ